MGPTDHRTFLYGMPQIEVIALIKTVLKYMIFFLRLFLFSDRQITREKFLPLMKRQKQNNYLTVINKYKKDYIKNARKSRGVHTTTFFTIFLI